MIKIYAFNKSFKKFQNGMAEKIWCLKSLILLPGTVDMLFSMNNYSKAVMKYV